MEDVVKTVSKVRNGAIELCAKMLQATSSCMMPSLKYVFRNFVTETVTYKPYRHWQ